MEFSAQNHERAMEMQKPMIISCHLTNPTDASRQRLRAKRPELLEHSSLQNQAKIPTFS